MNFTTTIERQNINIVGEAGHINLEAKDVKVHWILKLDQRGDRIEIIVTYITKISGTLKDEEEKFEIDLENWPAAIIDNIEISKNGIGPIDVFINIADKEITVQ